jgi:hypothetical protein
MTKRLVDSDTGEITDETVPAVIALALTKVLAEVGSVPKGGHNRAQNYDFVRETDLVDKVRPLMAREGLFLNQDVIDHELVELGKTSSGSTMRLTIIRVRFTWVHTSGAVWPLLSTFIGYGADTGDKGVYKAMTGAEKYALFKSFLVSSGDDPEADEKADQPLSSDGPTQAPRMARRAPTATQGRGGHNAAPTPPQIAELRRLAKDRGLNTAALAEFISATLQGPPITAATPTDLLNFIQRDLSGAQVGQLVSALSAPEEEKAPDEPEEGAL